METDVPQNVIEALAEVRQVGNWNMFDRYHVTEEIGDIDSEAYYWLEANSDRYMDALNAMGEFVSNR